MKQLLMKQLKLTEFDRDETVSLNYQKPYG